MWKGKEGHVLREAASEEGEGGSGTRKGFKKRVFQSQDKRQTEAAL